MEFAEIVNQLKTQFGEKILSEQSGTALPNVTVGPMETEAVARFLKQTEGLDFETCTCISANDLIEQGLIELVYFLYSYKQRHHFTFKANVARSNPKVMTVMKVWRGANWHEREQYDLLGVEFVGHSDLRRLMMPPDWVGHPLRKDYKEPDTYNDWTLARDYPIGNPEKDL